MNIAEYFGPKLAEVEKLREKESIRRKHNNIAVKQEDTKA